MEANLEVMISNLNKCSDGIKAIIETTEIMESEFLVGKSPLFKTEDNFLSLASSGSSDCLLYCVLFSLPSAEGAKYIARYFEFGSLSGCYYNLIHAKLKEKFEINSVLPYQVYTSQDVESHSKRQDNLYQKQKPHGRKTPIFSKNRFYDRQISNNKSSIQKLFNQIKPHIESKSSKCLFILCYSMYKIQKWSTSNASDNKRFLLCSDGENDYWEKLLLEYRCVRDDNGKVFSYKLEQSNNLTLEEQIYILTSIPNDHFWSWCNQISTNVKFEQRLPTCTRYFPASPRNRIIQACCYREDPGKIVLAVLEVLLGKNDITIPYAKEKKVSMGKIDAVVPCDKKQSKTYGHRKRPFNKISIGMSSPIISSNEVEELQYSTDKLPFLQNTSSVQLNLFQYYCGQLFNHGVLKWRYMDEATHIVLMNDYDSDTGDFLVSKFIVIFYYFYINYL
ncbi:uncharacterized protein LOC136091139 [Hydra vulgaris]|uniref:Uncharacterized protein LOC136091139 n=1 Tax=Hydra vulgaris TaxID=6087 RepID=A0ABM4DI67_HYDVU